MNISYHFKTNEQEDMAVYKLIPFKMVILIFDFYLDYYFLPLTICFEIERGKKWSNVC